MCTAIAECARSDEVRELRNKARALEVYTRQAKNREAEERAREIRLRAERRAGELMLKEIKATGSRGTIRGRDPSGGAIVALPEKTTPTHADQGISKRQASDWQAIAGVPQEQFESALRDRENPPSTKSLVELAKPKPAPITAVNGATTITRETLLLYGAVVDFERKGYAAQEPADFFGGMTSTMQADWKRIVPTMCKWFARLPFMKERS